MTATITNALQDNSLGNALGTDVSSLGVVNARTAAVVRSAYCDTFP